ncbi:MAG: hypothetical protein H0X33_09630 [Taibaiella sp.]|nr:hypothetical protein [Taibaiella sp.]
MAGILQQKNTPVFYFQRIFGVILLLAMAGVFIFSAASKLYDPNAFDSFRWAFLDLGVSSITTAGVIARLFIGFEFTLGLFLLAHIFLKAFTYPAIIGLLVFFILYLILLLIKQGNNGNCGCFGNKISMKPLAAIFKNVIMIAGIIALMYLYPIKPYKNQEWLALIIGMTGIVAPFVLAPLRTDITPPTPVNRLIDLTPLYKYNPPPTIELRNGKHIIAFMSLTCPHCKKAAYLLQSIRKAHPDISMYLVLAGNDNFIKTFFDETHAGNIPHMIFHNAPDFLKMAGGNGVPAIYWINNSNIEFQSTYYQIDPENMELWIKH